MRVRREEVQRQIQAEEEDKARLQQEISVLTKQLAQLNSSLARKVRPAVLACASRSMAGTRAPTRQLSMDAHAHHHHHGTLSRLRRVQTLISWGRPAQVATKQEYDKVIHETDSAYSKILESSQMLLTVLKRESAPPG